MAASLTFVLTVFRSPFLQGVLDCIDSERADVGGGEVVAIDDGSTDDSNAILTAWAKDRPHVRLIRQDNRGVCGATNAGFAEARTDYVRFVDHDDLMSPGSTRFLLETLERTQAGLAYGASHLYAPGEALPEVDFTNAAVEVDANPVGRVLRSQPFVPTGIMVRREALAPVFPLDERYMIQDYQLALRAARRSPFVRTAAFTCFIPIVNPGRASERKRAMFRDTALIVADEVAKGDIPADLCSFALARTAHRAQSFLRREAKWSLLRTAPFLWTRAQARLWPFTSPAVCAQKLLRIASAYDRAGAD